MDLKNGHNDLFPRIQVLWFTAFSEFSNTCPSVLLHTRLHIRIYPHPSAECFCSASWTNSNQKMLSMCQSFTLFAELQGSTRLVLCTVNAEWRKIIRQLLRAWISGPGESDTESKEAMEGAAFKHSHCWNPWAISLWEKRNLGDRTALNN